MEVEAVSDAIACAKLMSLTSNLTLSVPTFVLVNGKFTNILSRSNELPAPVEVALIVNVLPESDLVTLTLLPPTI